jgi:hypothetical protein
MMRKNIIGSNKFAPEDKIVEVNDAMCAAISLKLSELKLGPFRLPAQKDLLPFESEEKNLNYLFLMSALLFDLKGLGGKVGKEWLHGSEYLFAAMSKKTKNYPVLSDPSSLAKDDVRGITHLLASVGTGTNNFNKRSVERAQILQSTARKLVQDYQGNVVNLLKTCGGFLIGDNSDGLVQLMQDFEGYSDPHFKKGFVFLKFITRLGFFDLVDKQNLYVPMDYHVIRVALRTGIIEVLHENLRRKLSAKLPASPDDDFSIRETAKSALKTIEKTSSFDAFDLDDIFWNIGRSHCHYSHDPMCKSCPGIQCTFESLLNYKCKGMCLLNTVCKGSFINSYKDLMEPSINTNYY